MRKHQVFLISYHDRESLASHSWMTTAAIATVGPLAALRNGSRRAGRRSLEEPGDGVVAGGHAATQLAHGLRRQACHFGGGSSLPARVHLGGTL